MTETEKTIADKDINTPPQAEFYEVEELSPCVHCEADCALLGTTKGLWKLICYNCMRQTAGHLTEAGAVAAWNNDWKHRVAGPPKWTTETPTEEGWYMARFYAGLPLEPVRIAPSRLGGFFVSTWDGDWHTMDVFCKRYPDAQWFKIDVPALPEEGQS